MLNVKSCFSISKSTIKIEEYVSRCLKAGFSHAAICDENFYVLPNFLNICNKKKIKPVFGLNDQTRFNFFAINRKGYELLVGYKNKVFDIEEVLSSEEIFSVYSGSEEEFSELQKSYNNIYLASDSIGEKSELDDFKIFFKEINTLSADDKQALMLIQNIGKITEKERKAFFSFDAFLDLYESNRNEKVFTNIEKVVAMVQAYDLKVEYAIPLFQNEEESEDKLLLLKTGAAFKKRISLENENYDVYKERFEYEYSVVAGKGFSRYLLLAEEIVTTAREIGAVVGPGRGSAVSSLLVYLLGITQPDPVQYRLMFERFLSEDREDEPDIDIDVDDQMRPELLKVLNEKYGKNHMVHVITFGTYGEKLVKREMKKHIDVAKNNYSAMEINHLIETITGLPHHVSTHAAGIIFSEKDLRGQIPLQDLNETFLMTQYDMDSLKNCGIFKMDVLGLITLSLLKEMGQQLDGSNFPFYNVVPDEKKVIESLKSDNLKGVFQLDSRSGRLLAKKFTPKNFDEIRVMISLNRPGPNQSGLTDEWINRRNGNKKVEYFHPLVKEILSDTYGVPIFQEQIMEMSIKLGGFSPKQAHDLRKAMAKKDPEQMKKLEQSFIEGCIHRNMESDAAKELFNQMYEFAGYAFNKAHATAYSFITYWTAYTKINFSGHFYRTLIDSSHGKPEKIFQLIIEAVKNGIPIYPPDINKSEFLTVIEGKGLRLGLHLIKELNRISAEKIMSEREHGLFQNAEDFIYRIDEKTLSDKQLQKCIWAHLFWDLDKNVNYRELIFLRNKNKKALKKIGAKLFGEITENETPQNERVSKSQKNIAELVKNELFSYGFIVDYPRIFNLRYNPFMNGNLFIGVVIGEEKKNDYRISSGFDSEVLHSNRKLSEGDFILFQKKKRKPSLIGFYTPSSQSIEIKSIDYREVEPALFDDLSHLKDSGLKKIRIITGKGIMEVLL